MGELKSYEYNPLFGGISPGGCSYVGSELDDKGCRHPYYGSFHDEGVEADEGQGHQLYAYRGRRRKDSGYYL